MWIFCHIFLYVASVSIYCCRNTFACPTICRCAFSCVLAGWLAHMYRSGSLYIIRCTRCQFHHYPGHQWGTKRPTFHNEIKWRSGCLFSYFIVITFCANVRWIWIFNNLVFARAFFFLLFSAEYMLFIDKIAPPHMRKLKEWLEKR